MIRAVLGLSLAKWIQSQVGFGGSWVGARITHDRAAESGGERQMAESGECSPRVKGRFGEHPPMCSL